MADLLDLGLDWPDLDPLNYEAALPIGEKEWLDDLLGKVTVTESTSASPTVTKLNLESCSVEEAVSQISIEVYRLSGHIHLVNGLRRHWVSTHRESIAMHHCPVQGCGQRNPRDDKVRSHMQQTHKLLFPDVITSRRLVPVLPTSIFRNRQFMDPGTAAPPVEIGAVRPPVAREVQQIKPPRVALAALDNIQQNHTAVYNISQKRTASPTPEYQPTKMKISKPNVEENCDVKEADRAMLI